ncbi:MAG TPA: hypothetical protein VNR65_18075 [Geobacterales bacterium]|nr:hypothetical protein [Geobacterales bacterium]
MLTLMFRPASRSFVPAVALAAIITVSFFAGAALADSVVLGGTHPPQDIKGACGNANGSFTVNDEGYNCVSSKGSINCNWDGKCIGECDSCGPHGTVVKQGKNTIFGILRGTTLKVGTTVRPVHGPGSSHNPIVAKPIHNHPILERNGSGGKLK